MSEYYLIGSLRNPKIIEYTKQLSDAGIKIFSSWFAASENADDAWKEYEQSRGLTFKQALKEYAAQHVFNFDKTHLDRCSGSILVLPAGRSGHLELGYTIGQGKPAYILLEGDTDRWDVMYNFATGVAYSIEELVHEIKRTVIKEQYNPWPPLRSLQEISKLDRKFDVA